MSAQACERFDLLRRRVSRFVGDSRDGRSSVGELIRRLGQFGEVAIVGGMIRDLLLKDDYASFSSDVDLVLDAPETSELRALLAEYGAVENRFGGYALETAWKSDIWLLGRTWAQVHGHRRVTKVDDLLHTTFFNWDAIVYSWSRKRVICAPGYLRNLDDRLLDINLEPNPNRLGNSVRALRTAVLWGATFSPQLAKFVLDAVAEFGVSTFLEAETRSYRHRRVLSAAAIDEAIDPLTKSTATRAPAAPLKAARYGSRGQLCLALEPELAADTFEPTYRHGKPSVRWTTAPTARARGRETAALASV